MPQFEEYPESEQKRYVIAQLTAEANRTGILKLDSIEWIADFLIENNYHTKNVKRAATALRGLGAAVTPERKEALGISRRAKLGSQFLDCLTENGKADVIGAAEAIAYWSWHGVHFFTNLEAVKVRGEKARMIVDSRFSCECAKPFVKVVLPSHRVPLFPLDSCKKWRCTCGVDTYTPKIMGPAAPTPRLKKMGIVPLERSKNNRGVIDPVNDLKLPSESNAFVWIGTAVFLFIIYKWLF